MRIGSRPGACAPVVVLILGLALLGCAEKPSERGLARLLPDPKAVPGTGSMGDIAEYEGETLYDFLDGGAEIYFDYGIVSIASAEYRTVTDKGVEVSVYDMGNTSGAFGIYSNVRYSGADFVSIGNEGMLTLSSLDFWKGRFYCRLLTFDTERETQAVMLELGKALAANITDAGSLPGIVETLPGEGRVPRSEKLFSGPIGLNNIRFISSENVFNLGRGTQGISAAYEADGADYTLFVIEYGSEREAAAAAESFRSQVPDEAGITVEQGGRYLAGVWDLDGDRASVLLEVVKAGLENRP